MNPVQNQGGIVKKRVALLFPGQGAQYVGMGKDIYEAYPEARELMDRSSEILELDIRKVCFEGPTEKLQKTRFAQPAIFVVSMACLEVLKKRVFDESFDVVAGAGLSLGEATALVAAGAVDLEEGLQFVRQRGLYMDEASEERPGTMAAVLGMEPEKIEAVLEGTGAQVANLNGPGQVVISGPHPAVEKAIAACQAAGARRAVALDVSGAFHSSCMDPATERIRRILGDMKIKKPDFPVYSNLTAKGEADPEEIRGILADQMNHRTLWEDSMRRMISGGVDTFYEIGPGRVLRGLMRKIDPTQTVRNAGTHDEIAALVKEVSHVA
ncbi:MAG: ACP S-malonyltransferase [Candidatus Omnitrophica bacterium]|nr:ACP S-malonyltransferase [Candidatus Omnitrophota bacterium]